MSTVQNTISALLDDAKHNIPEPTTPIPSDMANQSTATQAGHATIPYQDHTGVGHDQTYISLETKEKGTSLNFIAKVDLDNDGKPELTATGVGGIVTITQGSAAPITLTGDQAEQFKSAISAFSQAVFNNTDKADPISYSSIAQLLEDPSPATVGKVIKTFQSEAQPAIPGH